MAYKNFWNAFYQRMVQRKQRYFSKFNVILFDFYIKHIKIESINLKKKRK